MFFSILFLWSRRTRRIDLRRGTFRCPHCESQQSCVGFTQMRGREYEGDFVECDRCQGKQRGEDFRFSAETRIFEPVLWECPYCRASNPNNTFRCRSCYKSLV